MLNDKHKKFLEISKKYENLKKELKSTKEDMLVVLDELGVGAHFQDPDTGAVYEIIAPKGTFVAFDNISYIRTKLEKDERASLSIKKAEEMGYSPFIKN